MFRRIFGPGPEHEQAADATEAAINKAGAATGDTKTVQYVVAQLDALPPERARLVASAAYTLARAAQADLEVSDEEMAVIQDALQTRGALDESTAHLVAELVKLQARTVGGTEDYVVVREFAAIANDQQKQDVLRACFLVAAASGTISAEESAEVNQIANELALDPAVGIRDPRGLPRAVVVGAGRPSGRRPGVTRPGRRRLVGLVGLVAAGLVAAACSGADGSGAPPAAGDGVVVTFQTAGDERFRVHLTETADIDIANRLVAGEDVPNIPNGLVLRGVTGVNEGYSWSLDPNDFEFAEVTIEVCDGLPSDVEAGLVTSDRYCPWSALIVDLQPAP